MSARRSTPRRDARDVAVIGLNRFGGQVADSLTQLGHQVLALDIDPDRVQRWSERLTQVVQADATSETTLRQLGLPDFQRAVVAIGGTLEPSVLAVLALVEVGVEDIWARATSDQHAKILSAVGARHVIFPEAETGERVAHLIVSRMLDFMEFGDDFAIAKVPVPEGMVGRALRELAPAERYGVMVVGAKLPGQRLRYVGPDTVLVPGSVLIVEGSIDQVQRFASLG